MSAYFSTSWGAVVSNAVQDLVDALSGTVRVRMSEAEIRVRCGKHLTPRNVELVFLNKLSDMGVLRKDNLWVRLDGVLSFKHCQNNETEAVWIPLKRGGLT